ncbi:hypothetical protein K438DRAFT_1767592 [Mycena galopus ATCC 62051]|nr:hypothetical protein K438DRAFT_1767592 [Mycena galopus ATCC 62051]
MKWCFVFNDERSFVKHEMAYRYLSDDANPMFNRCRDELERRAPLRTMFAMANQETVTGIRNTLSANMRQGQVDEVGELFWIEWEAALLVVETPDDFLAIAFGVCGALSIHVDGFANFAVEVVELVIVGDGRRAYRPPHRIFATASEEIGISNHYWASCRVRVRWEVGAGGRGKSQSEVSWEVGALGDHSRKNLPGLEVRAKSWSRVGHKQAVRNEVGSRKEERNRREKVREQGRRSRGVELGGSKKGYLCQKSVQGRLRKWDYGLVGYHDGLVINGWIEKI